MAPRARCWRWSRFLLLGFTLLGGGAWMSGKQVALTYQEFELLAFLSAHPDQVFSRNDLLAHVWGQLPKSNTQASTWARTRTVDVHVSRLRRKLGPVYGPCLATEYRVGYRFVPVISGAA